MATTSDQENIPESNSAEADPRRKSPLYESIADPGPNPLQGRTVTWDGEDGRQRTGTFLFNTRETGADGRQYAYVQYPEDVTGTMREAPIAVDRLRVVDDMAAPDVTPEAPQNTVEEPVQAAAAPTGRKTAPEPKGPGNRETLIGGDEGPEISEDERQRRAALLAAHLREIDEEDARLAEEERRKKAEDSPQGPQKEKTRLGNIYQRRLLQIDVQDNFFTVKGGTLQAGSATPQMSNAQLKSLIMTAALEKNWHTLYFYKDRSTIDPALTARAQQMIAELQRPGQPLHGYEMKVSPVRMRNVEPWNEGRLLYGAFRNVANYRQDTVDGIKDGISSRWNNLVNGIMYADRKPDPDPAVTPAMDSATETPTASSPAAADGTTVRAGENPAAEAPGTAARRANPGAGMGAGR